MGGRALVVEEPTALGTQLVFQPGLQEGGCLALTGSHLPLLLCVSTGKVGSEMF